MAKAIWEGVTLAESNQFEMVEGNYYFPADSINRSYFSHSDTQTICPWKGTACYYHITVQDKVNEDAAWYYPDPKQAADNIKGYVAFWRGVVVET